MWAHMYRVVKDGKILTGVSLRLGYRGGVAPEEGDRGGSNAGEGEGG